jgi:two-component system, LytTR family, sensor kinase
MKEVSPDLRTLSFRSVLWIWAAIAVFDATQSIFVMQAIGMRHAWTALYAVVPLSWLPWAFAAPFVVRLGRRYSLATWRSLSTWPRHLLAWVCIALLTGAWIACLEELLLPEAKRATLEPFFPLWLEACSSTLLQSLFLYAVILGVDYMLQSRQLLAQQQLDAARLNEQLSKSKLDALRHQIEPHFLFNTLNGIASLIRERRNESAVDMVVGLSDILRHLTVEGERQQVSFGEELQLLRRYIDIQKMRFSDRLRVDIDISPDLYPAKIPSLILQPIVENALKHGIATLAQGGLISITASRSDERFVVSVYNDGPHFRDDWNMQSSGIGLRNVQDRLHHMYGNRFDFIQRNKAGGVEVALSIPYERTGL